MAKSSKSLPPVDEQPPLRHRVGPAARRLGISRSALYLRLAAGEIRGVKDRGTLLITERELCRYVEECSGEYKPDPVARERARKRATADGA